MDMLPWICKTNWWTHCHGFARRSDRHITMDLQDRLMDMLPWIRKTNWWTCCNVFVRQIDGHVAMDSQDKLMDTLLWICKTNWWTCCHGLVRQTDGLVAMDSYTRWAPHKKLPWNEIWRENWEADPSPAEGLCYSFGWRRSVWGEGGEEDEEER